MVANETILGKGNCITSISPAYRSHFLAKLHGCLVVLLSIDYIFIILYLLIKLDLLFSTNCLRVICKLEAK